MKNTFLSAFAIFSISVSFAQTLTPNPTGATSTTTLTNSKGSEIRFTVIRNNDATPAQNQDLSNTCWSFSSMSFFESEMIRMGKGKEFNFSEMFVVRKTYPLKADNYVRMHGSTSMSEGGGFPDVLNVIKKYGMVPEEIYTGKKDPKEIHNQSVLDASLKGIVKAVANESKKIDFEAMHSSIETTCDAYLGKVPEKFTYKGKEYTPKTYAEATGINPDDYVYLTSFTHHTPYSKFVLEVPDNWNWELMYNLPLNEFQAVMENAIKTGFTFAWASDVSEKGFRFKDGLAITPAVSMTGMKDDERVEFLKKPQPQLNITPELRQQAFDNYETQDDHGMHIVGLVKDQNGVPYYIAKNSWGTDKNECDGYFYASESFVLYKTTSIMINKKAIPAAIAKKLGIVQ